MTMLRKSRKLDGSRRFLTSTNRLTVVGGFSLMTELKKPATSDKKTIILSPLFLFPTKEGFESLYKEPYQCDDACYHRITCV